MSDFFLPPLGPNSNETDWRDPWGAARQAHAQLVAHAIAHAISTNPSESARLRKAREDARAGLRLARPRDE